MLEDFLVANPDRLITDQFLDEIHGKGRDLGFCGELEKLLMFEDLLASTGRIVWEERRIADQHLEHDDSYTPPIDTFVVALLNEDFRGNVIWGANCGEGFLENSCDYKYLSSGFLLLKLLGEDRFIVVKFCIFA